MRIVSAALFGGGMRMVSVELLAGGFAFPGGLLGGLMRTVSAAGLPG
jgi:hypothetical protein